MLVSNRVIAQIRSPAKVSTSSPAACRMGPRDRETAPALGALGSRATRAAGYGEKPATYVISERDATLPADVAEGVAALAQATTMSLDSDHHPMLSRPAELALILSGILAHTALAEPARPDREPQS